VHASQQGGSGLNSGGAFPGANSASNGSPGMTGKKTATLAERVDRRVSSKVNQKRDSWPMRLIGSASEIGDQPQMRALCAGTIAVALVRGDRRLAKTGLKMLAAHTLATWGKDGVKAVIDRTRPDSGDNAKMRRGNSDAHDETSFPSGHSAGAVAVAEAFARSYPKHAVAVRTAALAVAAAQVPRGTHYAGDVAAGVLIGLAAERASDAAARLSVRAVDAGRIAVAVSHTGGEQEARAQR